MDIRPVFGIVCIAVAASISLPALVSAKGDVSDQAPQVTMSLLGSGRIALSGDLALQFPDRAAFITGRSFEVPDEPGNALGGRVVTDYTQDVTIGLWGYVIEAESATWGPTEGLYRNVVLRDAVISHSE